MKLGGQFPAVLLQAVAGDSKNIAAANPETQVADPGLDFGELGLCRIQSHAESLPKDRLDHVKRSPAFLLSSRQNDDVVRVPSELEPCLLHGGVQLRQHDIGKKRSDGQPLHNTHASGQRVGKRPGRELEPLGQKHDESRRGDTFAEPRQDHLVGQGVKAGLHVHLRGVGVTSGPGSQHRSYRVVRSSVGSKSIAAVAELRFEVGFHKIAVFWWPAGPVREEEAMAAWNRFQWFARSRRSQSGVALSRKDELLALSEELLCAMNEGDLIRARRLAADQRLDIGTARRMVPPRSRDDVSAAVLHARSDAAMQSGQHVVAARFATRALRYTTDPALHSTLWAILAASLRMAGRHHFQESVAAYEQAAAAARRLSAPLRSYRLRNITASLVAPFLATGDLPQAERSLAASLSVAHSDDPAWPEART